MRLQRHNAPCVSKGTTRHASSNAQRAVRLHSHDVANLPVLPPSPSSTLGGEGSRVRGKSVSSKGTLVTGRFVTRQVNTICRLEIEGPDGSIKVLEGTPIHPIWSVDRNDWIRLHELTEGETLQAASGPAHVRSNTPLTVAIPVYNIEVHGEHVYQVGQLEVLAHNACGKQLAKSMEAAQKGVRKAGEEAHHIIAEGLKGGKWDNLRSHLARNRLSLGC